MAVTHVGTSVAPTFGTTSVTATVPAGTTQGDHAFLLASAKQWTRDFDSSTFGNWALLYSILLPEVLPGGNVNGTAGQGQQRVGVFYQKVPSGGLTAPTIGLTGGTTGAVSQGTISVWRSSTGADLDIATAIGNDTGTVSGFTTTATTNPGIESGDQMLLFSSLTDDGPRYNTFSLSATGATFSALTELVDAGSATGDDLGVAVHIGTVTAGPATAAPVFTGTNSVGAGSVGGTVFVRFREVAGAPAIPSGTATGAWSFTGSASGISARRGTAVGSWSFTSTATGRTTKSGTATGAWSFTGSAAGTTVRTATASGAFAFTGTAIGTSASAPVTVAWRGNTAAATLPADGPLTAGSLTPNTGVSLNYGLTQYDPNKVWSATHATARTSLTDAVTNGGYHSVTISRTGGLIPKAIRVKAAKGGASSPRGFAIRSSVDGYTADLLSVADVASVRPTLTQYASGDLTSLGSQTSITFRIYHFAPTATASIEFDDLELDYAMVAATVTPQGSASGSWSFAGSAVGQRAPKATGSGSWAFTGTATGKRAPKATAVGSTTWTGNATGKRAPKATATGATAWSGTAVGATPIVGAKTGIATGSTAWTGTAVGKRLPKASATGTAAWVGGATGRRAPKASTSGSTTWTGTATGATTRRGTATGLTEWAGTAVGYTPPLGRDITLTVGTGRSRTLTAAGQSRTLGAVAGPPRTLAATGRSRDLAATGRSRSLHAEPRE